MKRRGFLGAILALGAAPAIVRASSLMKVSPSGLFLPPSIIVPMGAPFFINTFWKAGRPKSTLELDGVILSPLSTSAVGSGMFVADFGNVQVVLSPPPGDVKCAMIRAPHRLLP